MSQCAYIGEVRAFSGAAPDLWLPMDGGSVDATDYPDLAAVVPSSWVSGGNINLPDMNGRAVIGTGTDYEAGDTGGETEHTLTAAEMPAHTHSYELAVLATDILGAEPAPSLNSLSASVTGSTGGGEPHNNMPPYLALNWAIYAGV